VDWKFRGIYFAMAESWDANGKLANRLTRGIAVLR
jgi:hypothetical protein